MKIRELEVSYGRTIAEGSAESLRGPKNAASIVRSLIGASPSERFVMIPLNTRNTPMGAHVVSVGTLSASLVHPREVFRAAILANAASIVIAHNHPSGDVSPSPEDHTVTQRIAEAGKLMGIKLLDHIIIGPDEADGFYSFQERSPGTMNTEA